MIKKLSKWFGKARVMLRIRGIKSRDFSIIASNCTGTMPYRFLKMPYLSPTVNLFFHAPCYIKFVSRLDHYLAQELRFVSRSKYPEAHDTHERFDFYPIGVIDDVEIHFMHYDSESDALDKWNRRKARINKENMIFAFTDRDLCTPELMLEFDRLPLPGKKILLTAHNSPWLKSAAYIPAYRGLSEMGDGYSNYHHLSHIDYQQLVDGDGLDEVGEADPVSSLSNPV